MTAVIRRGLVGLGFIFIGALMGMYLVLQTLGTSSYIPVSQGHHGTHDVGTDPAATARFNHLVNSWNVANFSNPEDPNKINRIVCYVVKEGSKIARYVAWHGTRVSSLGTQYGNLNWWQLGEEGWEAYSYDDMNFSRLGLPKDLDPQRFSWENVNCDSMYPPGVSP